MQLHSFERRNSYIFFAILNQSHELFFAPPGIYIVFTSKRLPLQPVSSERNHQVADKFRKVSCLNVYGRKRGRVGVKQCMHSFDCLLSVFFDDYMSKLFPIFYLANFVCFYPSKYKAFPPNINYIFLILPYTK